MARNTIRRTSVLAVSTLAVVLLVVAPVGAAPRPSGVVAGTSSLNAIACPTAARCVAVGSNSLEDGTSAVVTAANAAGKQGPGTVAFGLSGIACPTPTTCVAVSGADITSSVSVANGALKLRGTLHAPTGQIVSLSEIACPTAATCYAAGFEGTESKSQAMIAHLSATGAVLGTSYETASSGIGGIACTSASTCLIAAANRAHPEKIQLLVNGHPGASHVLPAPTYIQAIECYKAVTCIALGGNRSVSRSNEILTLSPTTGAVEKEVTIAGLFSGNALACPNANQCIVVGYTAPGKPAIVTVTHGKLGKTTAVAGIGLSGVACTTAGVCLAVGQTKAAGLVERI